MNELNSPGAGMIPAIEKTLLNEFATLLNDAMQRAEARASSHLHFTVYFNDLAGIIGTRWAYLVLRATTFDPHDSGFWQRRPRTSEPVQEQELDVEALAPALRWAVMALDPLELCRPLMAGVEE